MEFDRSTTDQNTGKPTNRARFRHGPIPSQENSSYPLCMDSSDMPSKKMKLASSESQIYRSVVTGEGSVYNNRSTTMSFHNAVASTSLAGTSTIEEGSIHNGKRGGNFRQPSMGMCMSTVTSGIQEETVYSGRRGGLSAFSKPSTTTAMPGAEEGTVYNGKRGGALLLNPLMTWATTTTTREEGIQMISFQETNISLQGESSAYRDATNDRNVDGANHASTSGRKRRMVDVPKGKRDKPETIRVPVFKSGQSEMPPDGYRWWKCGQKTIKGSMYPRSYYKCETIKQCLAKKNVMKASDDPSMLFITYKKKHSHPPLDNLTIQTSHVSAAPLENQLRVTPKSICNIDLNVTSHSDCEMSDNVDIDLNVTPHFFNFL